VTTYGQIASLQGGLTTSTNWQLFVMPCAAPETRPSLSTQSSISIGIIMTQNKYGRLRAYERAGGSRMKYLVAWGLGVPGFLIVAWFLLRNC